MSRRRRAPTSVDRRAMRRRGPPVASARERRWRSARWGAGSWGRRCTPTAARRAADGRRKTAGDGTWRDSTQQNEAAPRPAGGGRRPREESSSPESAGDLLDVDVERDVVVVDDDVVPRARIAVAAAAVARLLVAAGLVGALVGALVVAALVVAVLAAPAAVAVAPAMAAAAAA